MKGPELILRGIGDYLERDGFDVKYNVYPNPCHIHLLVTSGDRSLRPSTTICGGSLHGTKLNHCYAKINGVSVRLSFELAEPDSLSLLANTVRYCLEEHPLNKGCGCVSCPLRLRKIHDK